MIPILPWYVLNEADLLVLLRRAQDGEDPDLLIAEEYANGQIERPEGLA